MGENPTWIAIEARTVGCGERGKHRGADAPRTETRVAVRDRQVSFSFVDLARRSAAVRRRGRIERWVRRLSAAPAVRCTGSARACVALARPAYARAGVSTQLVARAFCHAAAATGEGRRAEDDVSREDTHGTRERSAEPDPHDLMVRRRAEGRCPVIIGILGFRSSPRVGLPELQDVQLLHLE
jgi:hypothetical protein